MILTPSAKNPFRCEFIIASFAKLLNCSRVIENLVSSVISPSAKYCSYMIFSLENVRFPENILIDICFVFLLLLKQFSKPTVFCQLLCLVAKK